MRRVASDQRLKDLDSAPSVPSELGSSTRNGDAAASSCPNLDSMPGARSSPSNLGAGAHSNAPLDASVFDDLVRLLCIICLQRFSTPAPDMLLDCM